MAPIIPYEEDKNKKVSGEIKFEAAAIAVFTILFSILSIVILINIVIALWHAGIIAAMVIIGSFSGLFAIGRALYHIILEKDFLE